MSALRVDEIFGPTIQGEGSVAGCPTVFVRLGGCDYRCTWCDTLHAVLPEYRANWTRMSALQVIERVDELAGGEVLISLSGGNPAAQDCSGLINEAHVSGHAVMMETQGSVARDWFGDLDELVLSPKPPSSGMVTDIDKLAACVAAGPSGATSLKVVVFDEADLAFARDIHRAHPDLPFFVQPGNAHTNDEPANVAGLLDAYRTLCERVASEPELRFWRVLPQLHVLAWGNARGV